MDLINIALEYQVVGAFIFGLLVSLFNHLIARNAIERWIQSDEPTAAERPAIPISMAVRYSVRYGTYLLSIYAAYVLTREPAVLLATGAGLLVMRNFFIFQQFMRRKEG